LRSKGMLQRTKTTPALSEPQTMANGPFTDIGQCARGARGPLRREPRALTQARSASGPRTGPTPQAPSRHGPARPMVSPKEPAVVCPRPVGR
jgi:hypothetical protein